MSFKPYTNTADRVTRNLMGVGYRGTSTCDQCGVTEDARGPGHRCGSCSERAFRADVRANAGAMRVFASEIERLDIRDIDTLKHAAWEAACDYHRRGGK